MTDPYGWIGRSLATIHRAHWYRSPQTIAGRPGPVVELDGQLVINFASNDYLGLAGDPRLIQAAIEATKTYGTGSTGSRLLTGHRTLHRQLEQAIAQLKQTEDAIVFSSGYLANLGTIGALVGPNDLIMADRYNHSSLKNGAKLSAATVLTYPHADADALASALQQARHQYRRCLIATDSVFSMEGDLCPLPQIMSLAQTYDCMVLIDEAHATGVLGNTGAGCVEHFGGSSKPIIQMGTLSKALGSLGGYVAGSAQFIDYLRNRAATWIYTTALSPADTAAALAAIHLLQTEPERRSQLWHHVRWLKAQLSNPKVNVKLLPTDSPIFCLECVSPEEALQRSQGLQTHGIFAPAIRPPTVPTSRIRLTVIATHERSHLVTLVQALNE